MRYELSDDDWTAIEPMDLFDDVVGDRQQGLG